MGDELRSPPVQVDGHGTAEIMADHRQAFQAEFSEALQETLGLEVRPQVIQRCRPWAGTETQQVWNEDPGMPWMRRIAGPSPVRVTAMGSGIL